MGLMGKAQDRPATGWQQLGDISDGVVDRLRRRRDHHLVGPDDDQINTDGGAEHNTKVPV